jgi:hypothetical protein
MIRMILASCDINEENNAFWCKQWQQFLGCTFLGKPDLHLLMLNEETSTKGAVASFFIYSLLKIPKENWLTIKLLLF